VGRAAAIRIAISAGIALGPDHRVERPALVMVPAPSLLSPARQRPSSIWLAHPRTVNSDAWQPAGEPGLDLGSQVIQEAGPLGGLGRGGGQGQEDGEDQRADDWTVGQT